MLLKYLYLNILINLKICHNKSLNHKAKHYNNNNLNLRSESGRSLSKYSTIKHTRTKGSSSTFLARYILDKIVINSNRINALIVIIIYETIF